MYTIDSETCGLHGMPVILQYAKDDGPIIIYSIWENPIYETLALIEELLSDSICGFNLAFDMFMLCKVYTTFAMMKDYNVIPEDHIEEIAILEERARFSDFCLKPKAACDIMLIARKGIYQSLMDRNDIKIRRVPTALAFPLAAELEERIKFDDVYFARKKDKTAPRWGVYDVKDRNGDNDPNFKDIKLKFKASAALKHLAKHALGIKVILHSDIELSKNYYPNEFGFAPFALAVAKGWIPKNGTARKFNPNGKIQYQIDGTINWRGAWPAKIREHILHWKTNKRAREYAAQDIDITRRLWVHLGSPTPGDTDSELACMVASVRWRGYNVNRNRILRLKKQATLKLKETPTSAAKVKRWLFQSLDEMERLALEQGTGKKILEEIAKWTAVNGEGNEVAHPAAIKAKAVLTARAMQKKIQLFNKILLADRFHASFKVIGALSNRMSGGDGLNAQGIDHFYRVRAAFTLSDYNNPSRRDEDPNYIWTTSIYSGEVRVLSLPLVGGDFKSFEVSLAAAVFDDENLNIALKSGKKIHAIFAMELFPGKTYEEILASDGRDPDFYDTGKKGIFAIFYGGEPATLKSRLGIAIEIAEQAYQGLTRRHPGIGRARQKVADSFCSMRQPAGIGTKVEWHDPAPYIESFLGFRRYYTLENAVCKTLFELAQDLPAHFKSIKIKVQRRDRVQTASGATASALYAAAFGIQAANMRAANNHLIQSPGATIAKEVQRSVWNLQPVGVHLWVVQPMNIHDEIECPAAKRLQGQIRETVQATVQRFRPQVPLLAIDWVDNIPNWAGKKG